MQYVFNIIGVIHHTYTHACVHINVHDQERMKAEKCEKQKRERGRESECTIHYLHILE